MKTALATGRHPLLILLCVSIPSFMINLDANIVAVSLSSIGRSLHADFSAMEWVISAYTLAFASLLMPAGALADRFGRKRMLLTGLGIFTLASLACGRANSVIMLNAARSCQGLGAALQLSAALAILSHTFQGAERARAFSFWGAVVGIAIALGPLAGGLITQHFGWQWAFYINVPVGLLIGLLTLRVVAESRDPQAQKMDFAGVISFSAALSLLTFALIAGNRLGWNNKTIALELCGALLCFVVFIRVELRQTHPMLDLRLFKKATFIGANIAGLAFSACLLTMLTYLPVYLQGGLGFGPQRSGFFMLPLAIPLFIVPRLVALYLAPRLSGRWLLTLGLMLIGIGMFWIGCYAAAFHYPALIAGMIIAGTGAGILNGEVAKVGMTVIPAERAGMASGVSGTVRFSGIVVGFAALGAVLYHRIGLEISRQAPHMSPQSAAALSRRIAAGDLSLAPAASLPLKMLALQSFGAGYQTILFTVAGSAVFAALLTWLLVRARDTPRTFRG
jgi:EmrB/QacA subfamily drug resistance transporter